MSALQPFSRLLTHPSMPCDGGAALERAQFVKPSGERIPLKVPGSKLHDVKLEFGGGSFRFTESLRSDVVEGSVQVQRINITEAVWSELF